jgi:hypothetical protein
MYWVKSTGEPVMVSQRQSPSERIYPIGLTQDDIYEVCNALNSEAKRFEELSRVQKCQPESIHAVWSSHAYSLRTLTRKILAQRTLPNGGRR